MSNPNNPFDSTIWDPYGEHAIEDPMHGPSAVHDMLQTPAMPLGDGRYYQPGAYSTFGTPYLDSQDRPILGTVIGRSMADSRQEGRNIQEWLTAYHESGDELVALETTRQLARLEETGFADCFKPSDVCPGGKRLGDCDTGSAAYEAAQEWAAKNNQENPGDGTLSNVLAWVGGRCVECSVSCEVAVKTLDGKSEETRVSFYKPDPTIPTIELQTCEPRALTPKELEAFKLPLLGQPED